MEDYDLKVLKIFMELRERGIEKVIAFLGGSELKQGFECVDASLDLLRKYPVAILTGGTSWGLPEYASFTARKIGLPVIGVFPRRGRGYVSKNLDFAIEVEPKFDTSEWGDSSEVLVKIPHGVEIIGGGMGTLIEAAYLLKINEGRVSKNKTPVYISPISGFGGVSDQIYSFEIPESVRQICLPEKKISEGVSAAQFLINKIGLDKK